MSSRRVIPNLDHLDQTEPRVPGEVAFDVVSAATQAIPPRERTAAIAGALVSVTVGGKLSAVHLRIFRGLLARLDWSSGATRATTVADLCGGTNYTVRTVTCGLKMMVGRRLLLEELVPTALSSNARCYVFPALAELATAGNVSLAQQSQSMAKIYAVPNAPRLNESQIQRAVVQHLQWRSVSAMFWFAVPNGGYRTNAEAAIFSGQGVIAGVPDLIVIARGLPFGLELKTEHGVLTAVQRETQARMRQAGAIVATTYGLDDTLRQLEAWGVLRPDAGNVSREPST